MQNLSEDVLKKINNPIQLPSNNGDPRLYITLSDHVQKVQGTEDLRNWVADFADIPGEPSKYQLAYLDRQNLVAVKPDAGRERFYYQLEATAGNTYTCEYSLCSPSGFDYHAVHTPDHTATEYSFIYNDHITTTDFKDYGHSDPWNNEATDQFLYYRMSYICDHDETIYFNIPFENVKDGVEAQFIIADLAIYASKSYDITDSVISGSVSYNNDNKISTANLKISNAISDFTSNDPDKLPFKPGVDILIQTRFGKNGTLIDLSSIIIDEVDWTLGNKVFTINGRNHVARLKETYCGTLLSSSGFSHEVLAELLEHAGITLYELTIGDYEHTYYFKATDTISQAIAQVFAMFPGFDLLETPGGKVVIGYAYIRDKNLPVGVYEFSVDDDIFTRSIRQCSDMVYGAVYATGRDENGVDLEPEIISIPGFAEWNINPHKYYFIDSDVALTQAKLHDWALEATSELQYVGVTEEYDGPFRPQLSIGDVAKIKKAGQSSVLLGVITSITHNFSMEEGFSTTFSVDSGGVYSSLGGVTKSRALRGYNRTQGVVDLIQATSEKVIEEKVPKISYTVVTTEESGGGSPPPPVVRPRNTIVLEVRDI